MTATTSQPPQTGVEPAAIYGSTHHLASAASCSASDPDHAATIIPRGRPASRGSQGNVTAAARTQGQWLREQRQARGWNVQQMARELREAAARAGDKLPGRESLIVMIRRWERGDGISERYRLHYCAAFKIPVARFGDPSILDALHPSGKSRFGTYQAGAARPRPSPDWMQAALKQVGDPAERDRVCFMLGYLCALMTTTAPAPQQCVVSGDTTEASGRTQRSG